MTLFCLRSHVRRTAAFMVASSIGFAAYAQDTTISFRFNDPNADGVLAAISEYEKMNPGVKIDFQRLTWGEARQQYLREYAVGGGPDVVHIAFVWPKGLGQAGALLPLNEMIEKKGLHSGIKDFVAHDLALDGDTQYAVPWTTDTWSMIYRTDLLKEAGITETPKTWEDLLNASRKIKEKTGKVGFGIPLGSASTNTVWFLANFFWWSNGVGLVVEDGKGGYKVGVSAEDIAKAMTYYKTYLDEDLVPEGYLALSSWFDPVLIEGLSNGDVAMGIMPPPNLRSIVASYKEKNPDAGKKLPFTTGPSMTGSFKPQTHLGGKMLGINPNTKNPEAAYDFLSFMTSKSTMSNHYTGELPAQYSLLKTIDVEPWMQGTIDQLSTNARVWGPYIEGPIPFTTMWNSVGREFGSAFVGEKSIDEAAADLLKTLETELAKKK